MRWLNKTVLMAAMILAGLGLLAAPVLLGLAYPSAATISSGVAGAIMVLVGIGLGYGSLDWWSRFALGIGTWTLVAPMLLGFYEDGSAFWAHMVAGFITLLCGVAGHELIIRTTGPKDA